jgi:hypothetical protein
MSVTLTEWKGRKKTKHANYKHAYALKTEKDKQLKCAPYMSVDYTC